MGEAVERVVLSERGAEPIMPGPDHGYGHLGEDDSTDGCTRVEAVHVMLASEFVVQHVRRMAITKRACNFAVEVAKVRVHLDEISGAELGCSFLFHGKGDRVALNCCNWQLRCKRGMLAIE